MTDSHASDMPRPTALEIEQIIEEPMWSWKSALVGLLGVLLFHFFWWWAIPADLFKAEPAVARNPYRDFSIELEPAEEQQKRYTQTNPEVAENIPDKTDRFGARNQQAANPELPDEISPENRPASESEDTIPTDQVLTGNLEMPELAPPPSPASQQNQENQSQDAEQTDAQLVAIIPGEAALLKEIPLFGSMEEEESDETGIANHEYERLEDAPTNVTKFIDGQAEEGEEDGKDVEDPRPATVIVSQVSPGLVSDNSLDSVPAPRPRPKLPKIATAPVLDSNLGVSNVGQLATDADKSKFGEYLERLIETVSINWNSIATESSVEVDSGMVRLRFILSRNGLIEDLRVMEKTTGFMGVYMARSAIERGQPYGPWPQELIDMFGEGEEITFSFYYR